MEIHIDPIDLALDVQVGDLLDEIDHLKGIVRRFTEAERSLVLEPPSMTFIVQVPTDLMYDAQDAV